MKLEFFDVGHGACALLTSGNSRVMFDCASSTEFDFFPGDMLEQRGVSFLDLLVITNYDEDHARGLPNLLEKVKVDRLKVNTGVDPDTIDDLKGFEPGPGISAAIAMAKRYTDYSAPPLQIPNVEYKFYSHSYPKFQDENNLSLVTFLKVGGVNFLFTGDMECDGMEALLDANPGLANSLQDVHVYVAPHHGRETGKCDRIFDDLQCSPKVVVISDKSYIHETQLTVPYYRSKVIAGGGGWDFRGEERHVLTTRNDGSISFLIEKTPTGWSMAIN